MSSMSRTLQRRKHSHSNMSRFLSDATANHSTVASFAGSTSRATHKGTFTAFVQCTNNKFHHFVQRHSALVVPDASRTLFSISQALICGQHVHFGTSPGLLLHHSKAFIPFVRDTHTGMYLLPLAPPNSRYNVTYPLQQAMRATVQPPPATLRESRHLSDMYHSQNKTHSSSTSLRHC
jgi:hypothetical protein